jgi:predicted esterase
MRLHHHLLTRSRGADRRVGDQLETAGIGKIIGIWALRFAYIAVLSASLTAPSPLAAQADVDVVPLQREFNQAYQEQDWQRAISLGLEIERLRPGRPDHRYNLACVHALGGDLDGAIRWLQRSAASGFTRMGLLRSDPDLAGVRDHGGYTTAVAAVERNLLLLRAAITERFEQHQPLLFLPPKHDPAKPSPLLIAMHGFGGGAEGYPSQWRRAAARENTVLVIPQGVRPAAGGYSWGDPEDADIILGLTLDWVRERLAVDDEQIVLTGFSQGGFMAMELGRRHPELFVGVIPMAGGYYPELDGPAEGSGRIPRYYFIVGAQDGVADQCRRAASDYAEAGYEVELRVLPGIGHTFPRKTDRELGKALRFALGH